MTRWLKSAQMGLLNSYKKLLSTKQKVFTFKDSLKGGIHSSPSKMNMPNSVMLVLLTCIHLLNKYMIYYLYWIFQYYFTLWQWNGKLRARHSALYPPYIPLVRTIWTSYESKKCQPWALSCLGSLRDVSLSMGSIADTYFPCSALHIRILLSQLWLYMVGKLVLEK